MNNKRKVHACNFFMHFVPQGAGLPPSCTLYSPFMHIPIVKRPMPLSFLPYLLTHPHLLCLHWTHEIPVSLHQPTYSAHPSLSRHPSTPTFTISSRNSFTKNPKRHKKKGPPNQLQKGRGKLKKMEGRKHAKEAKKNKSKKGRKSKKLENKKKTEAKEKESGVRESAPSFAYTIVLYPPS